MMAQVHIDAIQASRYGNPWYIVRKGADVLRCTKNKNLLSLLKDNYEIQVKYVNGVGEYTFELNIPTNIHIIEHISRIVFGQKNRIPYTKIYVNIQEHFNMQCTEQECLWMYLSYWVKGKMKTIWITPKDKLAEPNAFRKGQNQAKSILDLMYLHGIKQNPARLLFELEHELIQKAQKEFFDDVLNAIHTVILEGFYPTWEDLCVKLPVPKVIVPGCELEVWGEDNDAEERYYSIWFYWNDRKDWFTIYSNSSTDADLIAALEAAILRMKAQTK